MDKFHDKPETEESAVAAMLLLSLFTGVSATYFLKIDILFDEKRISKADGSDGYLFRYSSSLEETKHVGNIGEYQKSIDTSHHWDIHIPSVWIETIEEHQGLMINDLKLKLKEWFSSYCLGSLSIGSLAQQLPLHIARITPKGLFKEFIKNQKIHHEPTLAYAVFDPVEMNRYYQKYLSYVIGEQLKQKVHLGSRISYDYPVIWEKNAQYIGSQKLWSLKDAKQFISTLKKNLDLILADETQTIQKKINTYAVWMWTICLLTLGIRPNTGAPGLLTHYDGCNALFYVHDKESKSRPYGRYIPVTDFLKDEISKYQTFLQQNGLTKKLKPNEKSHLIYFMDAKNKPQIITADFVKTQLNSMNFYLYKNWARHFLINSLNLPIDIQKTLYAHDSTDLGFSDTSSLCFQVYKTKIIFAVEKLLIALGLVVNI